MGRSLMDPAERRAHARERFGVDQAGLAARLRTGSPLRVLNTSPDGMLVESPARLLPGRQVNLVLESGASREHAPWLVIHSRVGCIRGSSDLRYRVGLRRAMGTGYPHVDEHRRAGYKLPAPTHVQQHAGPAITDEPDQQPAGTRFGRQDRT